MMQHIIPHKDVRTEQIGNYKVSIRRQECRVGDIPKFTFSILEDARVYRQMFVDLSEEKAFRHFDNVVPILQVETAKEALGLPRKRQLELGFPFEM
jgi:hypothetical protein